MLTLPDITIWTAPGQHHEIKHKNPLKTADFGAVFGLEEYRLQSLVQFARTTRQRVMYTIHNHDLSGGRDGTENRLEHWFTANILRLSDGATFVQRHGKSWYDGNEKQGVPIWYWSTDLWVPLRDFWAAAIEW